MCCPSDDQYKSFCTPSVGVRLIYGLFFLLSTILAWCIRSGFFSIDMAIHKTCSSADCSDFLGAFRVSFAVLIYHSFMCIFLIGVKNKNEQRASFHNSWWLIKLPLLIGLIVVAQYFDQQSIINYAVSAMVMAVLFLLMQALMLVDFAHSWVEDWLDKSADESRDDPSSFGTFKCMTITAVILLYAIIIGLSALFYVVYASNADCDLNTFFITLNLLVIPLIAVFSVLKSVQDKNPKSSIIQAGLIGIYTTYLIGSALASEPFTFGCVEYDSESTMSQVIMYIGIVITFIALLYTALRTAGNEEVFTGDLALAVQSENNDEETSVTSSQTNIEDISTGYSYSFFHFSFALAAAYMGCVLTNWSLFSDDSSTNQIAVDQGFGAVWAKVVSSWTVFLMYIWTLFAPVCFPDRDFNIGKNAI